MNANNKRGAAGAPKMQATTKKPRKGSNIAKSLGLTKVEYDSINAAPVKKALNAIVAKLKRQVREDWHNGWGAQADTKRQWFNALQEPLQAVLDIGVGKEMALLQCNDVLNIVATSFDSLLEVPCRCDTQTDLRETLDDCKFKLELPWVGTFEAEAGYAVDAWSYVWVALLRVHSNKEGTDEALLLQCIKEASENRKGAEIMEFPGTLYDQNDEGYDITFGNKDGENVPDGTKLAQLVKGVAGPGCVGR